MKKSIFSIIMILVGILIIITCKIIDDFNWYLRSDFLWLASFLITFGIFLLGLSLLKKIKNKVLKIFLNIFWTLILIVVTFVEFMLLCWFIKPTIIKKIDGVKYCGVEYITNRLRKNVYYYKEYNIFAYHETKEYIQEFYDYKDYEHPEFRKYNKEIQTNSIIYYYDDNGNITEIRTYDEDGNIIEKQ